MLEKILNLKKNLGGFFFDEEKYYVCFVFLSAQQSVSEIIDAYVRRL